MIGSLLYSQGFNSHSTYTTVMTCLLAAVFLFMTLIALVTTFQKILNASEPDEVFFERDQMDLSGLEESRNDLSESEMVSGIIQGYLSLEPELRQHIREVGISSQDWQNGDQARCAGMVFRPEAERLDRFSGLKVDISQHTISQFCPGGKPDPAVFANALSGVVYNSCRETRERAAVVGVGAPANNLGPLAGGITGIS